MLKRNHQNTVQSHLLEIYLIYILYYKIINIKLIFLYYKILLYFLYYKIINIKLGTRACAAGQCGQGACCQA